MTPYMAQGAASAIEDAVILARCLAASSRDKPELTLKRYELTRMHRATQIQQCSGENNWMRTSTNFNWIYGCNPWAAPSSN